MIVEAAIDLETWGIRTTSVVRSVGIIVFEGSTVVEKHYFRVDEAVQIEAGRTYDMSTVTWWRKPENAAAQEQIAMAPLLDFDAAGRIVQDVGKMCEAIWSKPGMFDLPILRDMFGQHIWPYWKERDFSTLLAEFDPQRTTKTEFKGVPHVAVDDAAQLHEWIGEFRRYIRAGLHIEQPK